MIAVSVIIPVYNAESHLEECIQSVLKQTMNNIEIICVNDGSVDQSLQILRKLQESDTRIEIIDKSNRGAAHSRNVAINKARGEYLFFLDSDDWLPSGDVLDSLYSYAKVNDLKVCGGSLYVWDSGKFITEFAESQRKYVFNEERIINYRDYQFDLGFTRFIYNREMILDNNIFFPEYKNYEDPVFCVKALMIAEKIGTLKKCVYIYRKNPDSASHNLNLNYVLDMICGMRDNLKFAEDNGLVDLYRTTYRRLNKEALCEIEECLNYQDEERKLFKLLIQVDAMINREILGDDSNNMLEALQMVYQEYKKYEIIRNNRFLKILRAFKGKRLK